MGEHYDGDDSAMGRRAGEPNRRGLDTDSDHESLLTVLAHPRRRRALEVLTEYGMASLRDVATGVAARELAIEGTAVSDHQRRDVAISLYHIHLPRLADAGMIRLDDGMQRIRPAPVAEAALAVFSRLSSGWEPDDDTGSSTV